MPTFFIIGGYIQRYEAITHVDRSPLYTAYYCISPLFHNDTADSVQLSSQHKKFHLGCKKDILCLCVPWLSGRCRNAQILIGCELTVLRVSWYGTKRPNRLVRKIKIVIPHPSGFVPDLQLSFEIFQTRTVDFESFSVDLGIGTHPALKKQTSESVV